MALLVDLHTGNRFFSWRNSNRICRKFIPFRHCPHDCDDPTDNRPTKDQVDVKYSPGAFHMHPPRQTGWHEIKNSADNKQYPFGDFHRRHLSYYYNTCFNARVQRCQ